MLGYGTSRQDSNKGSQWQPRSKIVVYSLHSKGDHKVGMKRKVPRPTAVATKFPLYPFNMQPMSSKKRRTPILTLIIPGLIFENVEDKIWYVTKLRLANQGNDININQQATKYDQEIRPWFRRPASRVGRASSSLSPITSATAADATLGRTIAFTGQEEESAGRSCVSEREGI